MARRRRSAETAPDLDVLDPDTGELASPPGDGDSRRLRGRAVRRRRAASVVLAALSAASLVAAAYFGLAIHALRGLERSWTEAMAVDDARAELDGRARDSTGDDTALLLALATIGDEAGTRLEDIEMRLAGSWVLDAKLAGLRDRMVEAIRFRRFQLTPQRRDMGSSPLQRVEVDLAEQLDRYGLRRSSPPSVSLAAGARLGKKSAAFANWRTGTRLVAVAPQARLVTIDIDASTVSSQPARLTPQPSS